jgi:hypothetical protein
VIEEAEDGLSLNVLPNVAPSHKTSAVMFGMYSAGLIIFGMAVRSMMLLHLLR